MKSNRKETGAFYTRSSVADYIADWAITDSRMKVLEPSFGEGEFLRAATRRFSALGAEKPSIYGVEIQQSLFEKSAARYPDVSCALCDFMDYRLPGGADAAIGNPPYVRFRNLSASARDKALSLMRGYGIDMPSSGSLWMPFVAHAAELLNPGGRLGFVLPYEITYVRYAFKLWERLCAQFGKLSVCRIYKDFFPEVSVETVIFLAENKGGTTDSVEYQTFETIHDLRANRPLTRSVVPVADILRMGKPFEWAALSHGAREIIKRLRDSGKLAPLIHDCKFKIGYVCGNREYFRPSEDTAREYGLDERNLIPCLTNAQDINSLKGIGTDTGGIAATHRLFLPQIVGAGERAYIAFGEARGVHQAYKCRVRNPWYITPDVNAPDVILTVFGDMPRLLANSGGFPVSNSLLCGHIRKARCTARELVCRWYNSLTLLMVELYVHSLGGGTLVLIPGETDKMELLSEFPKSDVETVFQALDQRAASDGVKSAYELGDEIVLKKRYGFTDREVSEIRASLAAFRSWRKPDKRRRGDSAPKITTD